MAVWIGVGLRLVFPCGSRLPSGRGRGSASVESGEQLSARWLWVSRATGCGVLEHEAQPFDRVGGIQRHIGASGLEHGQQGHDHLEAALHADGHPVIGPDAQFSEIMRQPVGSAVQLRIAQRSSSKTTATASGVLGHLLLEQLMHALVARDTPPWCRSTRRARDGAPRPAALRARARPCRGLFPAPRPATPARCA